MKTKITEEQIQMQVADYLRLQYPDVLFHSDFGSGARLTPSQAVRQKRLNGGNRAWPDMFIAEPLQGKHGLFIEFKASGVRLLKRDQTWASQHIAEQALMLNKLNALGYKADFAVGFDEARGLIDGYMKLGGGAL